MKTFTIIRFIGKAYIALCSDGRAISVDNPEFLEWYAKEPVKLDLSDKPPEIKEINPEELEFSPEERKNLRTLLKRTN